MISYEVYKMIHLLSVILMFSFFGIQAFGTSEKLVKISAGIFSLLLFVSGMGLIARIGISHGEPWPYWLKYKVGTWLVVAIGTPIFLKRMSEHSRKWFSFLILILLTVLYMVQYKI